MKFFGLLPRAAAICSSIPRAESSRGFNLGRNRRLHAWAHSATVKPYDDRELEWILVFLRAVRR